jgi:hypothetical protein
MYKDFSFQGRERFFIAESLGDERCVIVQIIFSGTHCELKIGEILSRPTWNSNPSWIYLEGQDAPR